MGSYPLRVLKFSGSALSGPQQLAEAVSIIRRAASECRIAVVVAAMGDTTDLLLQATTIAATGDFEKAKQLAIRVGDQALENAKRSVATEQLKASLNDHVADLCRLLQGISLLHESSPQTIDEILSHGERISAVVLAAILKGEGLEAFFVDARDWVQTDNSFGQAQVNFATTRSQLEALKKNWADAIPINTGFLGRSSDGKTTTLGRNGSDYTATLLAQILGAEEVQFWADLPGVMTADPELVSDAYPLRTMSYMEAVELANYGGRLFHPRTMMPLMESEIPLRILNCQDPEDAGTLIHAASTPGTQTPTSVTSLRNVALLDVEWRRVGQHGHVGQKVLQALASASIPVWMASQGAHGQSVAIVIDQKHVQDAQGIIEATFQSQLASRDLKPIGVWAPVTLLSLICDALRETPNVAGRFFQALGGVGVNLRAIAQGASSRSISCVIDEADTAVAVRTVHAAFNFADQRVSLLVMGKGVVGSELLEQVSDQYDLLEKEHGIALKVVGIGGSDRLLFDEEGIDLGTWRTAYEALPRTGAPSAETLDALRRLPVPILVDCTAADGMDDRYIDAFKRGIHVVAANKKPLSEPQDTWKRLIQGARDAHRFYSYETTVGASLPVIETLKNLVRTGDRVSLIEGCLSGTLGYLTNEVMKGVSLSKAVRNAKNLGYTEPHPQDDLSGLDVARKALILARELGLKLDLGQVDVTPLVPEELLAERDVPRFFEALEAYDATFEARIASLKNQGESLRYLAQVNPEEGVVSVGPVGVPSDHPATQLQGSEGFVAFTTERYQDYPLIVRGAGAGGAVTAAGVLADILTVAQTLRGR